MRALTLAACLVAAAAFADPPSAEQMAKIQNDIKKAEAEVDKKYEGRELSNDERKQQIKEKGAAESAVLDKAGVDRKDYARGGAKMSLQDRAKFDAEKEKLEKKDKAGAAGGDKGGNKEVVVEKGGAGGKPPLTDEEEAAAMDKQSGYGKSAGGGKKRK